MQAKSTKIGVSNIKEGIPKVREIIKNASLAETFSSIDSGVYGCTVTGLKLLEIMETSVSVFIEAAKQLKNIIVSSRGSGFNINADLSADDIRFINIFSLFAASVVAVESCDELSDSNVKVEGAFKQGEVFEMISAETSFLPAKIIKDYQSYVKFYRDSSNPAKKLDDVNKLLDCTTAYFKLLKNSLAALVCDSNWANYKKALEDIKIEIMNNDFEGFTYTPRDFAENNNLMKIYLEDVIGNKEYITAAVRLAKDVAGFDFDRMENPKQINPVLFALGSPGCGKTATAHAVGNYFLDFCKERGIKSKFVIIRRSDWASSYQNASANQLIDVFKRNVVDYDGVAGIYWPDIDTAFAARGESGIRDEEKNILGALFGLFDGTILPKNGKWFMMCDANFLNMDKAVVSRITQDPYFVKGPESPADFVALFRDVKLKNHKSFLSLSDEQWENFGKKCVDYALSGRSAENMARKAVTIIEDFEYPTEYFSADFMKKKEIIKACSKTLEFGVIDGLIENYVKFEKEAEEKASKKRFEDRVSEIVNYLSAEKMAKETIMKLGF